jgi:hypothetical protein
MTGASGSVRSREGRSTSNSEGGFAPLFRTLPRRGALPPFRTSPRKQVARAKPALEADRPAVSDCAYRPVVLSGSSHGRTLGWARLALARPCLPRVAELPASVSPAPARTTERISGAVSSPRPAAIRPRILTSAERAAPRAEGRGDWARKPVGENTRYRPRAPTLLMFSVRARTSPAQPVWGRFGGGRKPPAEASQRAAMMAISTRYFGEASRASTVARAGVWAGSTHASQAAFISS